jgi:hypothetical protein
VSSVLAPAASISFCRPFISRSTAAAMAGLTNRSSASPVRIHARR